ncbi:MAG: phage tail protein [Polaromonas sp.]|uniref:phage tail protein n=1 Tax=Burkholderiales TaxID=80840 RepID=UPI004037CD86
MSNPYVGEIRLFAGNYAPLGWQFCNGQLLSIADYDVLFTLIGTTYGGDGQQTFAVPDLRGRVPMHQGQGYTLGQMGGTETVTLLSAQLPAHTHTLRASTLAATGSTPGSAMLAATSIASYDTGAATTPMAASGVGVSGGSQPHDNMAPTLAVNYIISLFGIFPPQN